MGVKKLFTFLNNNNLYKIYPYLNDLINELNIDKKKLIIGIDANLFCYKYIHSYDNMLIGFFNQILKFLSNKIIPLYIFDGGTIQEKENTNIYRYQKKIISKNKLKEVDELLKYEYDLDNKNNLLVLKKKLEKNSIKINNDNILLLLELFDLLNIPYIFSYGEGEYLAVLLNKYNIIDFFLTDDTDPIPAGINKTIKFYNNNVYFLETKNIYKELNLNFEQFCDFCILLGSDYASFHHGLKPHEIYELILEFKSIENIFNNNKMNCLTTESFIIIDKIRNIYNNSHIIEKKLLIDSFNTNDNTNDNTNNTNDNTNNTNNNINLFIDHTDYNFYSNIMLEFWDDLINIINNDNFEKNNIYSNNLKFNINNFIANSKFNIKNIIRYIKNNIKDITEQELSNAVISFEYLNKFGI